MRHTVSPSPVCAYRPSHRPIPPPTIDHPATYLGPRCAIAHPRLFPRSWKGFSEKPGNEREFSNARALQIRQLGATRHALFAVTNQIRLPDTAIRRGNVLGPFIRTSWCTKGNLEDPLASAPVEAGRRYPAPRRSAAFCARAALIGYCLQTIARSGTQSGRCILPSSQPMPRATKATV